ncbi:MAG: lipoyl synthase [Alistipes sp.]|nr:lipoyl synthase [Candidatus Alistipes equi]
MPVLHSGTDVVRKPEWLKIQLPKTNNFAEVEALLRSKGLNTICSSGKCPNKSECWSHRTATFMILGDICTRNCRFCATKTGHPEEVDSQEAQRVAQSVALMSLRHVVITSVTRDDLEDGGAEHWKRVVEAVAKENPHTTIEVLVPDFDARHDLLDVIVSSKADIVGHNIETVERLTPQIRSRATYKTSLETLRYLSQRGCTVKSGFMVGLSEEEHEIIALMKDLLDAGVSIITIGQYLRPTLAQVEVKRYVTPEEFAHYKEIALQMGFKYVASGPLVRSSYMAHEALRAVGIDLK